MTTIHVRQGELAISYGGELTTIRELSEQTGITRQGLWQMHRDGRLTVCNVMEYQRRCRVMALARENGLTMRQVQARIARGMTPVEAATKPARVYTRKACKEAAE